MYSVRFHKTYLFELFHNAAVKPIYRVNLLKAESEAGGKETDYD